LRHLPEIFDLSHFSDIALDYLKSIHDLYKHQFLLNLDQIIEPNEKIVEELIQLMKDKPESTQDILSTSAA
jgi:hypothetical protein